MNRTGTVVEYYGNQGYQLAQYVIGLHTTYLCPRSHCRKPSLAFFDISTDGDHTYISEAPKFLPRGQAEPMPDLPGAKQTDRLRRGRASTAATSARP